MALKVIRFSDLPYAKSSSLLVGGSTVQVPLIRSRTLLEDLEADKRRISYTLPLVKKKPSLNYTNLNMLSQIDGLGEGCTPSSREAHELFMKRIPTILSSECLPPLTKDRQANKSDAKRQRSKSECDVLYVNRPSEVLKHPEENDAEMSHEISYHLSKLHKQRTSSTDEAKQEARINTIRRILTKPSFERKADDICLLCRHLRHFKCFLGMPQSVLLGLCAVGQLDIWEQGFTIPGAQGMYLILKGSASPQIADGAQTTSPAARIGNSYANTVMDEKLQHVDMLRVGDHFGTLAMDKFDVDVQQEGRILSAIAMELCEVLLISTSAFQRVIQHVAEKEAEEKFQLVHNCNMFTGWPTLSLKRISRQLKWLEIIPGEVLADEGTVCDVICFIKSGICELKKTLSVAFVYPDGRKIKKNKKLVVGTLGPGDSFGEQCVLGNITMEHAIISKTSLVIGYLNKNDIEELDEVTAALFSQTYEDPKKRTSEDLIEKRYIERQANLEWKNQKDRYLNETLHYRGIIPGYSKWRHSSSS